MKKHRNYSGTYRVLLKPSLKSDHECSRDLRFRVGRVDVIIEQNTVEMIQFVLKNDRKIPTGPDRNFLIG